MAETVPYEQRQPTDIVFPERFPRIQIDRDIKYINDLFSRSLGPEHAPLQASVDYARATGGVALLDVGCGTGNTLRSWRRATAALARVPVTDVTATGITLYDYHRESLTQRTEAAVDNGEVDYHVGDALRWLRGLNRKEPLSNITLAFNSLVHMRDSVAVLRSMVEATSPGGSVFFNIKEIQNMSNSPTMEYMYILEAQGCETDVQPTRLMLSDGTMDYYLVYIKKPNEVG